MQQKKTNFKSAVLSLVIAVLTVSVLIVAAAGGIAVLVPGAGMIMLLCCAFFVILGGIVVLRIFMKRLLKPLDLLSGIASKISDSDYNIDIEEKFNNEFDDIGSAISSMAMGLNAYLADIDKIVELQIKSNEQHEMIMAGINYSWKLQKNLLPTNRVMSAAFSDYSVIWKPRDIVGGDIYWARPFDEGIVLCVCDCTGHGTPGALLTMLVVSAMENVVRNHNFKDTAEIIWQLEKRFVNVFETDRDAADSSDIKDGCDLAVLFIANDGNIKISAGQTNVFVCDGKEVRRIKGQNIFVGEGKIKSKEDIETISIPANPSNKFYIASDGLFDQPGGENSVPFGYKRFTKIILENHNETQKIISDKVWQAFEEYRGGEARVDDFELITFKSPQ